MEVPQSRKGVTLLPNSAAIPTLSASRPDGRGIDQGAELERHP